MTTSEQKGFDEAAQIVSAAYAAGNLEHAKRLYETFHVQHLRPDMDRWLKFFVFDRNYAEDVYGRVLERISGSICTGRAIRKRELPTIYRRAAFDIIVRREGRHVEHREPITDEQLIEALIDKAANTASHGNVADSAIAAADLEQLRARVHQHLLEAYPKKLLWHALWLHMCEGITKGSELATLLDVTQTRARQLKKELTDYLAGVGRHFFADFENDDTPSGVAA